MPACAGRNQLRDVRLPRVMISAAKKRDIRPDQMFQARPSLARMRRGAFTPEEYRKPDTVGRSWAHCGR